MAQRCHSAGQIFLRHLRSNHHRNDFCDFSETCVGGKGKNVTINFNKVLGNSREQKWQHLQVCRGIVCTFLRARVFSAEMSVATGKFPPQYLAFELCFCLFFLRFFLLMTALFFLSNFVSLFLCFPSILPSRQTDLALNCFPVVRPSILFGFGLLLSSFDASLTFFLPFWQCGGYRTLFPLAFCFRLVISKPIKALPPPDLRVSFFFPFLFCFRVVLFLLDVVRTKGNKQNSDTNLQMLLSVFRQETKPKLKVKVKVKVKVFGTIETKQNRNSRNSRKTKNCSRVEF